MAGVSPTPDLLSPFDDHLIHQIPAPLRSVETSDPRAYDRYWMVGYDVEQEVLVTIGGSVYPNLALAEAYVLINHRGTHASVRMTAPLGSDRTDMRVGPLVTEITRPMAEWRFRLEAPEFGMRLDLLWFDTMQPRYRAPEDGRTSAGFPPGRPGEPTAGFESFGELSGWLELQGKRITLNRDTARGTRDRHWGIRHGVGGESLLLGSRPPIGGNGYQFVNFDDWRLWADTVFIDTPTGPADLRVRSVDRAMRFDDARQFSEAVVTHHLQDGSSRELHFVRTGHVSTYMRCGFYGGPNGGAPGSGRWQGQLPPMAQPEGEILDTSQTEAKLALAGLTEHLCLVSFEGRTVPGILQTYDPIAHDLCARGSHGWSFL